MGRVNARKRKTKAQIVVAATEKARGTKITLKIPPKSRKVPAPLDHNQEEEELDNNAGQSGLHIGREDSEGGSGEESEEVELGKGVEGKQTPRHVKSN